MKRLTGLFLVFVFVNTIPLMCNAQSYKGFIEGGRTFHTDDIEMFSTTDFYTTHGVQLGSYFYLGAGAGVRLGDDYTSIPIYGNVRYTVLKKKISPFIDLKIGYNLLDAAGFYINPGAGVNWNFHKALSIFLKVGYAHHSSKSYNWYYNKNKDYAYPHGVSVSVGFGF